MPRAGGEAGKLGNFYEGVWTVDSVLDLLSGEAASLQAEPFDESEAEGIEFIKILSTGAVEYHSAKRQKIGVAWSLKNLTNPKSNGRSILGDLFSKLASNPGARTKFISQTGANELLELCDRARRCATVADLKEQLKTSKGLAEDFESCVLPLCDRQPSTALDRLKRLHAIAFEEQELLRRVAQKTTQLIYRPDGGDLDPDEVRRLLAEFVISRLGQTIRKTDVLAELESHGFRFKIWAADRSLMTRVAELNDLYLQSALRQFINGQLLPRTEAALAVERLTASHGPKGQLVVGAAGLGKTCVTNEVAETLTTLQIPVLCLRLDNLPHVLNTGNLGHELGLPVSPVIVLAGIASGKRCVLVIDQLDALSIVSGRNEHLWPVFHQLIRETNDMPEMRLMLACRAFDLHHDQRLRELTGEGRLAVSIELSLLSVDQVHSAVRTAAGDPQRLTAEQTELLRTPFNLQLFLQSDPKNQASFRSVKDLFDRFWDHKAAIITPKLKDSRAWDECVKTLAQELSSGSSSAPIDVLDRHLEDAKTMASNGVLILENRRWRFFHETFGDYAFARQFVREGRDLIKFLTAEGGEQHLYRRAQVRQILAYERDRDRTTYIITLRRLMSEPKVRLHIKKLALEWLSQLDDPGEDEWRLLESLQSDSVLGLHVFSVLWERIPWFDLLLRLGAWPKLLADDRLAKCPWCGPRAVFRCVPIHKNRGLGLV